MALELECRSRRAQERESRMAQEPGSRRAWELEFRMAEELGSHMAREPGSHKAWELGSHMALELRVLVLLLDVAADMALLKLIPRMAWLCLHKTLWYRWAWTLRMVPQLRHTVSLSHKAESIHISLSLPFWGDTKFLGMAFWPLVLVLLCTAVFSAL